MISSMLEVLAYLEWKQGPYSLDSGFSLTSFQINMITLGDAQSQNPRNDTQNIHRPHTQNTWIYLVPMDLGEIAQPTDR